MNKKEKEKKAKILIREKQKVTSVNVADLLHKLIIKEFKKKGLLK